jgi:hypothetical protein
MIEVEKLRVLIPYWIEHNQEHTEEYRRWANQAGVATSEIHSAIEAMNQVNASLSAALEKLGGPSSSHEHPH